MKITVKQITDQATADAIAKNLPPNVQPVMRSVPATPARVAFTCHGEDGAAVGCAIALRPLKPSGRKTRKGAAVIDFLFTKSVALFRDCLAAVADTIELVVDSEEVTVLLAPAPATQVIVEEGVKAPEEVKMDAARTLGFRCGRLIREAPGQSSNGDRFAFTRARKTEPQLEEAVA